MAECKEKLLARALSERKKQAARILAFLQTDLSLREELTEEQFKKILGKIDEGEAKRAATEVSFSPYLANASLFLIQYFYSLLSQRASELPKREPIAELRYRGNLSRRRRTESDWPRERQRSLCWMILEISAFQRIMAFQQNQILKCHEILNWSESLESAQQVEILPA